MVDDHFLRNFGYFFRRIFKKDKHLLKKRHGSRSCGWFYFLFTVICSVRKIETTILNFNINQIMDTKKSHYPKLINTRYSWDNNSLGKA